MSERLPPELFMQRCLALAARGAGQVSPNPLVGAVLASETGEVLGEGFHARYGGPHAEPEALADALGRGCTPEAMARACLYVNLEPCSHWGKTPPCADLILKHGIGRIVVGMVDPFPQVAGGGIARLRAAGAEVQVGVLEGACRRLNEAFVRHVQHGRPLVTVKVAQTLDGRIATETGESQWISGPEARAQVHAWRATSDAVLVGAGTARADNPALTVRLAQGPQPLRVVLDRAGALAPGLALFTDAHAAHTLAVVAEGARPAYEATLRAAGGRVWRLPTRGGRLDLGALLDALGRSGARPDGRPVQSVLVEAGPGLATAFVQQDLADRFFLFVAPRLLGSGAPSLAGLGVQRLGDAVGFAEHAWEPVGADLLFRGYLRRV